MNASPSRMMSLTCERFTALPPATNFGYRIAEAALGVDVTETDLCAGLPHRQATHGCDAPARYFSSHGHEVQHNEQQREAGRHDEQRPQQAGIYRRPFQSEYRSRLMERVPPVDGEFDDRNIYETYQRNDCRCPSRTRAEERRVGNAWRRVASRG